MVKGQIVFAPWTQQEVDNLNAYQASGKFHSFACKSGHGPLTATTDGWTCPACEYTQNWAHRFMMRPSSDWDQGVLR